MKRDRVELFRVYYGGEEIRNDREVARKLLDYAHSKAQFRFTEGPGQVFNYDPMPGSRKNGLIIYRYDGKGMLRSLNAKQHDDIRFEAW